MKSVRFVFARILSVLFAAILISSVFTSCEAEDTKSNISGIPESPEVSTTLYYVRRSYTDPADITYQNVLTDDTYWDVIVINSDDKTTFTEVTYPVDLNGKNRVREEFTWKEEGEYFYLYDEDDEKVNGAKVTITDASITRKAAIGFDYMEYIDMMYCEEVFELVTDISLLPTEASYEIPVEKTLADFVEAGSYCVPGWCKTQTTYSLLLVTPEKKAIWYFYDLGSRHRKEYDLSEYSKEGTVITEGNVAVEFSPQMDDESCQVRFKKSDGTWSGWHLGPSSDCCVVELMNSKNTSDFLCLTKFGAFGFVNSSRDAVWSKNSIGPSGKPDFCSDNGTSTVRITKDTVFVSLWEKDDYDEEEYEEPYGIWTVTDNSNTTIAELFSQLQ